MEDRKNIRNELWKINLCDKCKIFNEKLTQRDLQFFHVQFWANDHLIEFHLIEIDIFHLIEIVVIS